MGRLSTSFAASDKSGGTISAATVKGNAIMAMYTTAMANPRGTRRPRELTGPLSAMAMKPAMKTQPIGRRKT